MHETIIIVFHVYMELYQKSGSHPEKLRKGKVFGRCATNPLFCVQSNNERLKKILRDSVSVHFIEYASG